VFSGLVALADVAPTVLELAGLPPLPGANGASVVAALRDAGNQGRSAAWVETLATQLDMGMSPLLGVRTATHKYVRAPEPELYDLSADPSELVNRAGDEPTLAAELDLLVEERARGRPIVPSFRPDAEERARLEALGYLRGDVPRPPDDSLGRVGGLDPKRGAAEIEKIDRLTLLLSQRRGSEALAVYDELGVRGYTVRILGATAALQASQPERAEHEARLALEMAPDAEALVALGTAVLAQRRSAEARQHFEQAAALEPEKAGPLLALGWIAESEGRRDEAARRYEEVRALPVPSPEALWRLAALALEADRRDDARGLLAELPQAELRNPDAAQRLARAERTAGRPDLARTRIEGSLKEYPWIPELWLLKADLLDQAAELEGALAARREALRLAPGRPDVENAVAWTLARLGRELPEAEQRAEAAIERLGRLPPLLDTLASVRNAQGRHAEALVPADEGLERAAEDARVDLLFRRAEALAGLGRRENAEQALALAQREAAGQPSPAHTWPEAEQRVRRLLGGA
jgi:tetratricopeptide (TPR) repeat protein